MFRNNRIRMTGVTLIELLVVIVIAAILMGIAVPSYKSITTSYRISGEVNGLLGDLQFARAEAIKEGQSVTICALPAGATGTPPTACATAGGSAGWQNGWIVFPVVSSAPTAAYSAASVLRYQAPFTGNPPDTLVDSTSGTIAVTFNRDGLATGLSATGSDTFLSLHDPTSSANYTRCLQITPVGGTQVTQPSNNASCT